MKTKIFLIFLLIVLFSYPAIKSFLAPGLFEAHDTKFHIARIYFMHQELKKGQFPVRWLSDLNFAYGYPTFNFYYPLPYYLAQPFLFSGFSSIDAYKIVIIATFVLSGIFMFLWSRSYWGDFGGLVSAFLYLYAPYRFVSLYVNGTFGVAVSFAILPASFWSFYLLAKKYSPKRLVFAGLSLGLLLIIHNVSALIFLPLIISYVLFLILKSENRKLFLLHFLVSSILGFFLAAFFILPMIFELKYVRLKDLTVAASYQDHFPTFKQLIYSKWGYGYSLFGGIDGMAFQLGIAQWLVILFLVILLIFSFKKKDKERSLILLFLANFFIIFFLMLWQSNFIWQTFKILQRVQFPWKFLEVEVFIVAFLTGSITAFFGENKTLLNIIFLLLITLAFYGNRNHLRPATFERFEEGHFLRDAFTADASGELMPIWHKSFDRELMPKKLEVIQGTANVEEIDISGTRFVYKVKNENEAKVVVHTLYFPGWQILVDGQKVSTKIAEPAGLFEFQIDQKGEHQVEIVFKNTFVRNLGNFLSFCGIITVFSLLFLPKNVKLVTRSKNTLKEGFVATLVSTNPAKNYFKIGYVRISTPGEVKKRVELANKANEAWKELGIEQRIKLLRPLYKEFKKRKKEIALLITREIGKPIKESLSDLDWDEDYFKEFLKLGKQYLKDEITYRARRETHKIVYEPIGTAAVIVPWNFPFDMFMWGTIPNLIAGNTVVFKHSEECPLVGKLCGEMMGKLKLPKGIFSEVYGDGKVGEMLVNQNIDLVYFTGSSRVGKKLYEIAGKKLIKAILEMGGSNPAIVFEDVNIDGIIDQLYAGRFVNNGQVCDSIKRLVVHESIFDEVVEKLKKRVEKAIVGDPEDKKTDLGSLVAKRQLELLKFQVEDAIKKGAKIVTGGKSPENLKGAYYLPTVLTNVKRNMKVWKEEVFGPVLPIISFKTEKEAIELGNDTVYGLGAQVYSKDKKRALRVASKIEAGCIDINKGNHWKACTPFGGYKESGMGREHGRYGFQELCQIKVVSVA